MDKIIKIEDHGFFNRMLFLSIQSLKDLSEDKKSSNQLPWYHAWWCTSRLCILICKLQNKVQYDFKLWKKIIISTYTIQVRGLLLSKCSRWLYFMHRKNFVISWLTFSFPFEVFCWYISLSAYLYLCEEC